MGDRTARPFVPTIVREMSSDLLQATGEQPDVEQLSTGRWRITLANERVRLTIDYRNNGRGKFVWAASTLSVDGKARPLAKNFPDFVRIFRDPDQGEGDELAELPPMPPLRDPSTAPAEVQATYGLLAAKFAPAGIDVAVGFDGRQWVIGIGERDNGLRCYYVRYGKRRWANSPTTPLQLVAKGKDMTAEASGALGKAIALLAEGMATPTTEAPPSSGAVGKAASGARTNSVEVRRATVIRN